jgi:hypothetical protein
MLGLASLPNGQKTVVFQGMQHIGSEDFYKSVVFDLEQALADGYTLFYEGVMPVAGRPDLTDWFNQTLRGTKQGLSAGCVCPWHRPAALHAAFTGPHPAARWR